LAKVLYRPGSDDAGLNDKRSVVQQEDWQTAAREEREAIEQAIAQAANVLRAKARLCECEQPSKDDRKASWIRYHERAQPGHGRKSAGAS
jgi:hypothetical protein